MHLAIEAVGAKHSGAAVVLTDVLNAANRSSLVDRITVFCSPRGSRKLDFPQQKVVEVECPSAESSLIGRVTWLTSGVSKLVAQHGADVLLGMNGIAFANLPAAVFIQQSLPFCPEALSVCDWGTRARMAVIRMLMKRSCRQASLIVTQTPTMSEWVGNQFGIASSRISVVKPWGNALGMDGNQGSVEAMFQTPPHLRLLYVGNTSAYKNVPCLIRALPEIRRHLPGTTLFLSCTPDHPYCANEGVVGLGYLGGGTLSEAYQAATLFVTASLVESGNLTLVEAMLSGTPILSADRPYARDLCGDTADYFDPLSPESAARAIVGLLRNRENLASMSSRGKSLALAGRASQPYDELISRVAALAK